MKIGSVEGSKKKKIVKDGREPIKSVEVADSLQLASQDPKSILMDRASNIELRRLDVVRLKLRGKTLTEIATELGVSIPTVRSDIENIQVSNSAYLEQFSSDDFISDSLAVYRTVEEDALNTVFTLPPLNAKKVQFMDTAMKARYQQIKMLQSVGLLKEKPKQVQVSVNTSIDTWSADQKSVVAAALVEAAIIDAEVVEETPMEDVEEVADYTQELDELVDDILAKQE